MTTGVDLGPQLLGVAVLEQGPDDRARARATPPRQTIQLVWRDQVLRDEPAEPVMVDLADERPHGADHNTAAGRIPTKSDADPDARAPGLRRRPPARPGRGGPGSRRRVPPAAARGPSHRPVRAPWRPGGDLPRRASWCAATCRPGPYRSAR